MPLARQIGSAVEPAPLSEAVRADPSLRRAAWALIGSRRMVPNQSFGRPSRQLDVMGHHRTATVRRDQIRRSGSHSRELVLSLGFCSHAGSINRDGGPGKEILFVSSINHLSGRSGMPPSPSFELEFTGEKRYETRCRVGWRESEPAYVLGPAGKSTHPRSTQGSPF
jgi:hypothetical protein